MKQQSLFVTNGDSVVELIRQANPDAHILPWRDPMHHGPFPAGGALGHCSETRARYLAGDILSLEAVRNDFCLRDATLLAYGEYIETVLWFEHDLLDQLQILQILSTIDTPAELSIICINQFPGVTRFRGLGQLDLCQIESLYPSRTKVTDAQILQAREVWTLFCDNSPEGLVEYIQHEPLQFPYLRKALVRHFQEYPWASDGLSRTERQLLSLLQQGISTPGQLFSENMDFEDALFIGDWRTFGVIDGLATADEPLVESASSDTYSPWTSSMTEVDRYRQQRLQLTNTGLQVLNKTVHGSQILQRDMWLGGVHILSTENEWSWDDANHKLIHR